MKNKRPHFLVSQFALLSKLKISFVINIFNNLIKTIELRHIGNRNPPYVGAIFKVIIKSNYTDIFGNLS